MCLLVLAPAGKTIPEAHIRQAWTRNRDGAGFAYHTPGAEGLRMSKGYFDVEEFVKAVKKQSGKAMILHLRFATHGLKDSGNTHPFVCGGGWVMGHNGIISHAKVRKDESDTAAFVRDCIQPVLSQKPDEILRRGKWRKSLELATRGSKLAFLNRHGKHVIIHEDQGQWEDGIWYSNSGYKPYTPPSRGYYPSGKQDWYDDVEAYSFGDHIQGRWVRNTETIEEHMAKRGWKRRKSPHFGWEKIVVPAGVGAPDVAEGIHRCYCMNEEDVCDLCDRPFGRKNTYWSEDDNAFICQTCFDIITTKKPEPEDEVVYRELSDEERKSIPKGSQWLSGKGVWCQSWLIGGCATVGVAYRTPAEAPPKAKVYEMNKAHAEDDGPVCIQHEDESEPETPEPKLLMFPAQPDC